jgi:serine phosphatase RsbU (regulator of sigma subunit)
MNILVAWDDAREAELLGLYLSAGENTATVCVGADAVLTQAREQCWDALLLSLTFPKTAEEGFALFREFQTLCPGVPVVLACRQTETMELVRFLTHGLRFYLIRDDRADFIFLVLSSLESAVAAVRAEESRKLAEQLREEMDGVRRLQESIIPRGVNPPPGYRIAARYEPAQISVLGERPVVMAGGDYYDAFTPDGGTLALLVGDASGHGLKACMSIMVMHTLLRMFTGDRYGNTAAFVTEINNRLCENSIVQGGEGFITLFYAAIDTKRHTMSWTSAGHPLALLHHLDTNEVVPVGSEADSELPLAISTGLEYHATTLDLAPNSRVLLYTDGLSDAFPPKAARHVAFGTRGIVEALQAGRERTLDQALDHLFQASNAFTSGAGRHDDTSVVLLERLAT